MGLTKPRAYQIYDIDYKQAARAVAISNVTLSGGAPSVVDGVTLALNDRVLVTGQFTASQNGIYYVTTVGTGSNGTWALAVDDMATGELLAGTIIMVTEGLVYADTQWKLITDNPIVIGTTALTFVQNYSANSISAGTSNVSVQSNANVTISSAGTANVLTISSTGTVVKGTESVTGNITAGNILTAGIISATGNITGNYFIGNGSQLTGITVSAGAAIINGTSNVTVGASSNTTVGVAGTTVATFANTGIYAPGVVSATGNLYGNYILGNGASLTGVITSVANINSGTSNVTVTAANANITVGVGGTSNVAVFATTGEYVTGVISATGNITGSYIIGNGSQLTGLPAGYSNATAASFLAAFGSNTISTTGTITSGNIVGSNITTAGLISATGGITSAATVQGLTVSATANVIGGNITTAGLMSSTGNAIHGNILTAGLISATGTVTSSSFTGAGTGLTGTAASLTVGAATSATTAGTVTAASQPNITSVGSSLTTSGALSSGAHTITGSPLTAIINGGTSGVGNIGASGNTFNTVFAKATTAQYADLAEMYVADQDYPPGTVVVFGGSSEITISNKSHDPSVAGIISTDPAYLMNSTQAGTHVLPVALTGRVPCRVVGTIYKGDRLVASGLYPGVATGLDKDFYQPGCIIGKSLEDYLSTDVGVIEIAVGRF